MIINDLPWDWRIGLDITAAAVGGLAFLEYLPPIAAVLTILYTGLCIWETKTVQRLLHPKKLAEKPVVKPDESEKLK